MNNDKKALILGAVTTSILGVLFHFLYDWTGQNTIISLFCAINESTWEHLKLLFFPFLFWLLYMYVQTKGANSHHFVNGAISCFFGMFAIVSIFYTYKGILGFSIDFLNILIYFIGVFITFFTFYQLNKSGKSLANELWGILFFTITSLLFFIFTFHAPNIGLFISPV